jgi:hypothetical protein
MRCLNTLCGHNVGFTNGKAGRTQSRHSALKVNPWIILLQSFNVARLIADKVFYLFFFVTVLKSRKGLLFPDDKMQHSGGQTAVE